MLHLHFNRDQKLELSKAIFNFGNIIAVDYIIVNQAVFEQFDLRILLYLEHFFLYSIHIVLTLIVKNRKELNYECYF